MCVSLCVGSCSGGVCEYRREREIERWRGRETKMKTKERKEGAPEGAFSRELTFLAEQTKKYTEETHVVRLVKLTRSDTVLYFNFVVDPK